MCVRLHNKRNWPKGLDLKIDEKEAESFEPCWLQHGPSRKEIFFEPLALRRDSPRSEFKKRNNNNGILADATLRNTSFLCILIFSYLKEKGLVCVYTWQRLFFCFTTG
jgi:hypothetical protein